MTTRQVVKSEEQAINANIVGCNANNCMVIMISTIFRFEISGIPAPTASSIVECQSRPYHKDLDTRSQRLFWKSISMFKPSEMKKSLRYSEIH